MMTNKEQIAKWRADDETWSMSSAAGATGEMLDMLEQQQAEIEELRSIQREYLSLCLVVAAELHTIRCALGHLDENTPESINEKIRVQSIKLADTAKQLKNGGE